MKVSSHHDSNYTKNDFQIDAKQRSHESLKNYKLMNYSDYANKRLNL